jgi:hypothetical protein
MTRRWKIRLAGCVVCLFLVAAVPVGLAVVRARSLLYVVLYWLACGCLLLSLLAIVLLDLLESLRLLRRARIEMIRSAIFPPDRDES